jgi:hypothetical protein
MLDILFCEKVISSFILMGKSAPEAYEIKAKKEIHGKSQLVGILSSKFKFFLLPLSYPVISYQLSTVQILKKELYCTIKFLKKPRKHR